MINSKYIIELENFLKNNSFKVILFLWILSTIFFYFYVSNKYGDVPRYGMFDWQRYRDGAENILNGKLPEFPSNYFLSYCIYLALSLKFFFPITTLIFSIILNLFSAILIYKITYNIFDTLSAFFSLVLFLFYPYFQMWVFFIQPVSFFAFTMLLVAYAVCTYNIKKMPILIIFSVILTFTARPNGVAELISIFIFLTYVYYSKSRITSLMIGVLGIATIFTGIKYLSYAMGVNNVYDVWNISELGEFGYTKYIPNQKILIECTNFKNLELLNKDNSPPSSLDFWLCASLNAPLDVIKIFLLRFFFMMSFFKPVLSFKHNVFSLATLIPLYFFSIVALLHNFNIKKFYIILTLMLLFISVSLHGLDGDNRVYSAFLPMIFILSSGGLTRIISKFFYK